MSTKPILLFRVRRARGSLSLFLCVLACLGLPRPLMGSSVAREWNEQLLAAIRLNVPNPPAHARNLFHTAVAMYNAWAAYDTIATGYLYNEKAAVIPASPAEVEGARRESISYAAYRVLRSRFATGQGSVDILSSVDLKLTSLGYSTAIGLAAATNSPTPAELGKRIGDAVLAWGAGDGFSLTNYPQAYTVTINPNMGVPLAVLGDNLNGEPNMPLGYGIPSTTHPNFWQPLSLSYFVDQNGVPQPGGTQAYVGIQGLATTPFSLTRSDPLKPWLDPFGGPSRLSMPGAPSASNAAYKDNYMDVLRKSAKLNELSLIDISPAAIGNNPLGADSGTGHPVNPVTGNPYTSNPVIHSDYVRVLAEFWADGPNSETPPGHWHVLANEIAEHPQLLKKIRGVGPTLNELEWDVKTYFALSAAVHDAACAAWSLKRYYSGPRPITAIRYMGSKGQSSNPAAPSYHEQGLPLEEGVVELVTPATAAPGGKHAQIWVVGANSYRPGSNFINKLVVYSWPGEHPSNLPAPSIATQQSFVRWQLAEDWLPFQRKTFNTPAFPGYISGHSTFSRAAAEVLTLLTGSPYFPGGFGHHTILANSLQIDLGPNSMPIELGLSSNVDLQWSTYYDAADQAGQSRRWGGIHPYEDDYHGRYIGSIVGKSAFALAEQYWTGAIMDGDMTQPTITYQSNDTVQITWTPTRGMYHKIQASTALFEGTWTDISPALLYRENGAIAGNPSASYTGPAPLPNVKFYRIIRGFTP